MVYIKEDRKMPRSFTEKEKEKITEALIKTGMEKFGRYGLKKTTIDEIVRDAGIAKGSFYQFFPSKEALMFACIEHLEKEIRENDIYPLMSRKETAGNILEELFNVEFELSEKYPLLSILDNPQEFEILFRSVPEDQLTGHFQSDSLLAWKMMTGLYPEKKWTDEEIGIVTGLIRGLLMLRIHKKIIGEEIYADVIKLLSKALAEGLNKIICEKEIIHD